MFIDTLKGDLHGVIAITLMVYGKGEIDDQDLGSDNLYQDMLPMVQRQAGQEQWCINRSTKF